MNLPQREAVDLEAYIQQSQTGPCFICEIIGRKAGCTDHHILYEDDIAIAFLNKYPTLYGYSLVAPREHREQATGDFTLEEYLALQKVVYTVAEAVRQEVPTERMYILTLGSQQGNRHVHWHIAPLPPGVPYIEQQFAALSMENGILKLSSEEMSMLAERIRTHLKNQQHGK
ncbi:MAG: HIT family protein [Chloroflexota bacterium]|nr:HIT family protein [Chloroflexota bacterium]MDQ5866855.1 HIT family protein [Chloroflexota bacterium]